MAEMMARYLGERVMEAFEDDDVTEVYVNPQDGHLRLDTRNFRFSPRNASGAHVPGEGHAHVYVDGVKLGRFYGDWVHVPADAGEVRVALYANDHRPLSVGEAPVSVTLNLGG